MAFPDAPTIVPAFVPTKVSRMETPGTLDVAALEDGRTVSADGRTALELGEEGTGAEPAVPRASEAALATA
ncbi:hypothetical protein SMC4_02540 [Candidatus Cryosericum hinesii]|nr:hypothetical protein SMC4_02540 [Candidatus Cryosericum hinesii]